ncbi:MAG: hypothetical protein ThorAB25_15880 [Candidatus Thorarchaeota archaeon AB_25]|nr:MAG: hypothetical protein ThorAB25_15880 [Candidatus Thorarchaeota archaeon AB_25]
MNEDVKVRVFIESESRTIQAADMDTVGHPECTQTNSSDWGNGALGKGGRAIPQEHLILLDAASRAAEKLGLNLEVVDISVFSFFQKRKLKGSIPRIEIGEKILTGLPTSDEIVRSFH